MIRKCNCSNEWQDGRYGQGMRVMNACKPDNRGVYQEVRCTVCLAQYDIHAPKAEATEAKK